MRQFLKPYLLLSSSLICLLFVSCRISKFKHPLQSNQFIITQNQIQPIFDENKAAKFKVTIDVLKNHLSGIIIVKKTDSLTTHIIFVTEIGMKMFDFEWINGNMRTAYVFEPLNKVALLKILQENFKQMFLLDVFNAHATWHTNKSIKSYYELDGFKHRYMIADSLKTIEAQYIFHKHKKSCLINYIFVPETKTYQQIKSTQFGLIKIRMELNRID